MQEVQGLAYWFKRLVSRLKALQNCSSNAESSVRAKDPRQVKRIKCQARNTLYQSKFKFTPKRFTITNSHFRSVTVLLVWSSHRLEEKKDTV